MLCFFTWESIYLKKTFSFLLQYADYAHNLLVEDFCWTFLVAVHYFLSLFIDLINLWCEKYSQSANKV